MSQVSKRLTTKRLYIIVVAVCVVFFLIFLRLFILQVINHEKYSKISLNQKENFFKSSFPKRGDIFLISKDGRYFVAASNKKGFLAYLNLRILENPEEAFLKLSPLVNIPKDDFLKLVQKKDDPFEILQKKLTEEEAEKILSLGIKGVGITGDEWRFYPSGAFLSHVLGFASVNLDIADGRYGVEKFYNDVLGGSKSKFKSMGFFSAVASTFGETLKDGQDVFLTMEPTVQKNVEDELAKLFSKWNAKSGGAVVLEPKSGKIIAMAAFPEFDPNKYFMEKNLNVFLNPFTEKIFEMGSVFKPITMAIGIDSGAITPETTYIDKGFVEIGSAKLRNFDEKPRGERNMTQVLEESLNTGAVFAMRKTGKKNFKEYLRNFGFYEKTNIDLPGEVNNNLSNLESEREVEFATASFGQGIAVTPISMIRVLGILANGGKLIKPVILSKNDQKEEQNEGKQVIKKETAFLVSKMLVDVVDNTLAGGKAKIDGYSIAAKTGTAQIPDPKTRGYSEEFFHSFFGYFPAYDPKFLIFLFLEKPVGIKYASQTLTDPFINITKFLINYYTILPDR